MRTLRVLWVALAIAALPLASARSQAENPKPRSKIDSILEQMIDACREADAAGKRDLEPISNALARVSAQGELEVMIHGAHPIGEPEKADLRARGVRVTAELMSSPDLELPDAGVVVAWVHWSRMADVAALDWVVAIAPPGTAVLNVGAVEAEGAVLQGARAAQSAGIDGSGITVGIISNGVTSLAMSQMRGELPMLRVLSPGNGDEGTAMLEIVHDVAPGAALLFQNGAANPVQHQNAFMMLREAGANVITEDVGFLGEPVFQQGMLAMTADRIAASGVSVHSAAGNTGATHAARVNAVGTGAGPDGKMGPFMDCGRFPPTNAVAIAPNGDTTFDIVLGQGSRFFLQWSEPRAIFPTAGQGGFTDLDLYVMDASGTRCIARSNNRQANGEGDTIEAVAVPNAMAGTAAKLVVNLFGSFGAAQPPVLDLTWVQTQRTTDAPTRAGSINPDANYTGLATTSAAVQSRALALEPFSSGGPIQLGLTTLAGGARGPGPQAMTLMAPTFASVDGVSISGVGGFPMRGPCPAMASGSCFFFGTSASAPQSAACAALVLQSLGKGTGVAAVNRRLIETALDDQAFPGPDNVVGAGLLDCAAAARVPGAGGVPSAPSIAPSPASGSPAAVPVMPMGSPVPAPAPMPPAMPAPSMN